MTGLDRTVLAAWLPQIASAQVSVLASGWDCDAFAVGGLVIKRPKHAAAVERLQREAALLALVRPRVTLPVPDLRLIAGPPLMSWHLMLPGGQLLAAQYHGLSEDAQGKLGQDLGRFLAELHRISVAEARAVGALDLAAWMPPGDVLAVTRAVLPAGLGQVAERLARDFAALPPDPLGQVYGHFDGHGWNMAYDAERQVLNGIYDFADSGIGPRHQEFIYQGLVSFDLMERVMHAYEAEAGLRIDRLRVATLAGWHRLWELAEAVGAEAERSDYVDRFAQWCAAFGTKQVGGTR